MNITPRRARAVGALLGALAMSIVVVPGAAAHPLGNFTVNYHTGLVLHPDHVEARLVVDRAEIAAAQERPDVDRDGRGGVDAAEARAYAHTACASAASRLRVRSDGSPLRFSVRRAGFTYHAGEAGLQTSRLQCALTADADLRQPSKVSVRTAYNSDRIGWQEIIAQGRGVALVSADVPAVSSTDELRRYPADPLATPLAQRTATLRTEPGAGGMSADSGTLPDAQLAPGPIAAALGKVSGVFDSLVGRRELTVPVGLLALLLAVVLGASHAAMPGHGKTIMAAYLAGRRGTPRDAVTVGATVTLTHTAGVLVLGLALPVATTLAGETVLTWLGLTSGVLVTGIGVWLLRSAVRGGPTHGHHHHHHNHDPHGHRHEHSHRHEERHHHEPPPKELSSATSSDPAAVAVLAPARAVAHAHAAHSHSHESAQDHSHPRAAAATRGGLIGMGIAGGLVPSPSALVVLLGAVALGRTAFGVLLVLGYGLGMAATLTLAGLLLVRFRDRIDLVARTSAADHWQRLRRLARWGPVATSSLVLLVGVGLMLRAAAGPW
jgi:ABC-type nickel/cobalt efflux system permease component RcnA